MQNAPTNLHILHLDTFLIECDKPLQADFVHMVVLLQLNFNDLLDSLNMLSIETGVEHPLLQFTNLNIRQFTIEVLIEHPEDPGEDFLKSFSKIAVP